jgi:hypothetical protein
MLLRVSSEMQGVAADPSAVTDEGARAKSGVEHGGVLLAFAEAVVRGDDAALGQARQDVIAAVGSEGFVDAAGVVGNFQRMVRIADGTGIPLDGPLNLMTLDVQEKLGLKAFGSASNTPEPAALPRVLAGMLQPISGPILRLIGRVYRG